MKKLEVADIMDLRAYERSRPEFHAQVIVTKKNRRITVGEFITFVFENRTTMLFQIQEMARVEKIISDEALAHEVETYNGLIPDECELSATMFIELTDEPELRRWLPLLRGIQDSVSIGLSDGAKVRAIEEDAERLTRENETTTTVHYLKFRFDENEVAGFGKGGEKLVIEHPNYQAVVDLSGPLLNELVEDLSSN